MFSALEAGEWEFLSTAAEQSAAGRPDRHGKTGGSPERPSLDALTGRVSRSFDERSAVSWLTTLRRVFTYQHDDRAAAQAREAVAARIAADCRVVIGDASGSVVAWETLAEHPELSVDTLLTLGSPLVIDDVYRRLRSFGSRPTDARLPNIRRWVNIFDPDDPAGFGRLDPHWPDVQDYGVDNGPDHAAVVSYLGKRITGRTVAEAFPENRR